MEDEWRWKHVAKRLDGGGWMARRHSGLDGNLWLDGKTSMEVDCMKVPFVQRNGHCEGDGWRKLHK